MIYREIKKEDADQIKNISIDSLGWTSSESHLEDVLSKYPGVVAVEDGNICGFIYSNPLSSDILKISNFVVDEKHREAGIGSQLLETFEEEAAENNYRAIIFPQDPDWFKDESLLWLESHGYRSIYQTDQSHLLLKEKA